MSNFWYFVDESEPIRQGDIIEKHTDKATERHFGVIINADCDFAQNKIKGSINYLLCLPADSFVREYLSAHILEVFVEKRSRTCADKLNKIIRINHPGLDRLDANALVSWIAKDGADEVRRVLLPSNEIDKDLARNLHALEICLSDSLDDDFERISKAYHEFTEDGVDRLRQELVEQLSNKRSFGDFLFLPDLPHTKGIGFVVLLRELKVVEPDNVYRSRLDARLSGSSTSYVRIGRFRDRLKHLIAQKFAFLFSRIGMPETAETSQSDAVEIVVTDILFGET